MIVVDHCDHLVDALRETGVPVAIAIAGWYAEDIDDIHYATVRFALRRGAANDGPDLRPSSTPPSLA